MAEVIELSVDECEERLRGGVVGRLAYVTADGPQIVPLNYSVVGDAVVFRTSPYSDVAAHVRDTVVAFEADHVDYDRHTGWSVVVRGRCEAVLDPSELKIINAEWPPRPWASGTRPLHFRVRWDAMSGRRLGADSTRGDLVEVRRTVSGS